MNRPIQKPPSQQGAVLIVSLVFLLLFTVIGLATMRSTNMQESMANNVQDQMIAFEAAEAALRAGERRVKHSTASHLWDLNEKDWGEKPTSWWLQNATKYDGFGSNNAGNTTANKPPELARPPHFIIEKVGCVRSAGDRAVACGSVSLPPRFAYRITARSTGVTGNTVVILQSTIARYGRID